MRIAAALQRPSQNQTARIAIKRLNRCGNLLCRWQRVGRQELQASKRQRFRSDADGSASR